MKVAIATQYIFSDDLNSFPSFHSPFFVIKLGLKIEHLESYLLVFYLIHCFY